MSVLQARLCVCHVNIGTDRSRCAVGPLFAERDKYVGSDGRRKSTFEEAFRVDSEDNNQIPWQLSWQRNERNLVFADETNAHIVQGFVAKELSISAEEMTKRIAQLVVILPELPARFSKMKVKQIAGLAGNPEQVVERLISLKALLPTADVAAMAVRQPTLVLQRDAAELATAIRQLQEVLPTIDVCWLAEQHPQTLLDPASFESTIELARALYPATDIPAFLRRQPMAIFGLERRNSMIAYDS